MSGLFRSVMLASWFLTGSGLLAAPAPATPTAKADRKDRHGDPLPSGAFQRFGTVQYRNGAGILTIAYSPDGKRIASAGGTPWAAQGVTSGDRTIRVWDIATGKEVRQLTDHVIAISCLAFSPDSKYIAASTINDQTIRIWEIDSDKPPRALVIAQNGAATMTFAFSPDGKTLAVSRGQVQEIVLIDLESGKEQRARSASTWFPSIPSPSRRGASRLLRRPGRSCGSGTWPRARKSGCFGPRTITTR